MALVSYGHSLTVVFNMLLVIFAHLLLEAFASSWSDEAATDETLGAEVGRRDPMGLGVLGLQTSTPFSDHQPDREPTVLTPGALWADMKHGRLNVPETNVGKEQLFPRPLRSHRKWVNDVVCRSTYCAYSVPLKAWAMWEHNKL